MPGIIILNILRIYSCAPRQYDSYDVSMSSVRLIMSILEFCEINYRSEALRKTTMPGIIILNILRIYSYAPRRPD